MTTTVISLEKAQEILGDNEAIERGYVSTELLSIAQTLAQVLLANGFATHNGLAIYPNCAHLTDSVINALPRKQRHPLNLLTAAFMNN
jgi:hypothetical protein